MSKFACGYCQKSFASVESMKSHIDADHEEEFPAKNDLKNLTAGRISGNGTGRQNDDDDCSNNVFDFECFPCRLGFDDELSLQNHIEQNHQFKTKESNSIHVPNRRGKWRKYQNEKNADSKSMSRLKGKCSPKISIVVDVSENIFIKDTVRLNRADDGSDNTDRSNDIVEDNKAQELLKWSCSICEKKFQYQSRLSRHSIIHNRDNQERKFECKLCQKKFLRAGT